MVTEMDEKEIMEAYRKKLDEGLKVGKIDINDIERMMGEAITQLTEAVTTQTEEALRQGGQTSGAKTCPDCGRPLKKTK